MILLIYGQKIPKTTIYAKYLLSKYLFRYRTVNGSKCMFHIQFLVIRNTKFEETLNASLLINDYLLLNVSEYYTATFIYHKYLHSTYKRLIKCALMLLLQILPNINNCQEIWEKQSLHIYSLHRALDISCSRIY